jgi:excisionase family DNA binding protein
MPELMSINEVIEALRCSRTYVYELFKAGKIRRIKITNRCLVPREDIQALIAECEVRSAKREARSAA